ncbi:TonB-dependent receptor plug domain-containing protein [Chryseobacterium sp. MMS23-Vi53]|uniref:TonB-dependent receptor plug domain-containing protein n=1 Tax=Chryseobacterium sp. MMS23-Vi53 TaxID=3386644 RepID=UPI0039EBC45B
MKITIPKPCHENWNLMTPDEKGRFCTVCSKTVRDFTVASDEEIIDTFTNSTEEICGNFHESQLNRNLQYSYINSMFAKFAVGFIMTTGGFVSVQGQQNYSNDSLKAATLEEVVITGWKTKQKTQSMVTGASTVVSQEQLKLEDKAVKSLEGKIGGVKVSPTPKSETNTKTIIIGGAHTNLRDDKKPLVVLDEKIISLKEFGEIDPQSVETINILKDASATTLYGSQAKNGVILVTTKKKLKPKKN